VLHFHHGSELIDIAPLLERIANPFILDHVARLTPRDGVDSPAFRTILRLLETDRCYVKLASLYRHSTEPYPFRDWIPMVSALVKARPDRVIWGTNWPHPFHLGEMPNDGDLVDLIPEWIPDPADQHKVLVENPNRLYGFS
jgi:predicted TIM-barrel fold metal-dependent hydrolase